MRKFNRWSFIFDKYEIFKIKYLYVLALQEGKYYVGTTYHPNERIRIHSFGSPGCSLFVSDYLPIKNYSIMPLATSELKMAELYETIKTIELIDKYGFENVCGGKIVGDNVEYRHKQYQRYSQLIKSKQLRINYYKGIEDKNFNLSYNTYITDNEAK